MLAIYVWCLVSIRHAPDQRAALVWNLEIEEKVEGEKRRQWLREVALGLSACLVRAINAPVGLLDYWDGWAGAFWADGQEEGVSGSVQLGKEGRYCDGVGRGRLRTVGCSLKGSCYSEKPDGVYVGCWCWWRWVLRVFGCWVFDNGTGGIWCWWLWGV